MESWVKRLYVAILKCERKMSSIIMTRNGVVISKSIRIPSDMEIQEWIDKLQDK